MQTNMFEFMYDTYHIKTKIKLIEFFAGYGSQNLSLKYLGANYEHHRICEWATKSIQAYNDIHIQDYTDYSQCCTLDEIVNYLFKKGISMNYNEPMTYEQIKRKGEKWCRNVYNNIIATKNLVNIQQVKAKDLDITDKENYTYLLTYSFPCQDISGAGLGKGFAKGSGTRSGMLWEVERILNECYQLNCLPQCLVMENVPLIHSKENYPHLLEWIKALEKLGYQSYWQDLNAVDYGVPQNRNRTFMVSILGDYNYSFPKKFGLELRLKDLLESEVDEKYYLSESMKKYVCSRMPKGEHKLNIGMNINNKYENDSIAGTICTSGGNQANDNFIIDNDNITYSKEIGWFTIIDSYNKNIPKDQSRVGTIPAGYSKNQGSMIIILGKYIKGGFSAGQVVDKNGIAPTFMEHHGHIMAIVEEPNLKKKLCNELIQSGKVQEYDVIRHSYSTSRMEEWEKRNVEKNNIAPTLDTRCDCLGVVVNDNSNLVITKDTENYIEWEQKGRLDIDCRAWKENTVAPTTTTTPKTKVLLNNLRIRKLTPRECLKLMGLKNEDIVNISKNQSDSSLYHLAGDSIVTTCLMVIFGELLGIDWKSKINEVINDLCYTNIN